MTGRPGWLDQVAEQARQAPDGFFARHRPPGQGHRESAVLILVGPVEGDPDRQAVVLTERGAGLRSHAGQVAFPGGRLDPEDDGPVDAALREAHEEIGLDASGVEVVTTFPPVVVPVSNSSVTPVVAWWHTPGPVWAHSEEEVARVLAVPVEELTDPANRFTVTHPSGYRGAGFEVGDLFVWGFTAALLDRLLVLAGLDRPWDDTLTRDLPARVSGGRAPVTSDPPAPRRRP